MRGDYPRADHRECRMKEISGICRCAPALYPNLATPEAGRQRRNENDVNARKKTASFDAVFKNEREDVSACAAARLLGQLAETFTVIRRKTAQMAEAEFEGGVGDIRAWMREQAFACRVEPDVAQQIHWCDAMMLMAQGVERAHADAGGVGQIGQRQWCAKARTDVFLQHVQALQLAGAHQPFRRFVGSDTGGSRAGGKGACELRQQELRRTTFEMIDPRAVAVVLSRQRQHAHQRLDQQIPMRDGLLRQQEQRWHVRRTGLSLCAELFKQGQRHFQDQLFRTRLPPQTQIPFWCNQRRLALRDAHFLAVGFNLGGAAQGHVDQRETIEQARPHDHLGTVLQHEDLQLLDRRLEEHRVDVITLPEQIMFRQFIGDLRVAIHLPCRLKDTMPIEWRQAERLAYVLHVNLLTMSRRVGWEDERDRVLPNRLREIFHT